MRRSPWSRCPRGSRRASGGGAFSAPITSGETPDVAMLEFGFMCLFDRCARRVRLPAKGIAFVRYTTPEADGARKRTGTRSGKHMGTETEIKLRVHDLKELRAALQRLGARSVFAGTGRVFESNLLFDTPGNQLAKRGELLRI